MYIRKHLIVKVIFIVIQLSFIVAQDVCKESEYAATTTGKSREINTVDALNHEIDTLINDVADLTQSISKYVNLTTANTTVLSRPSRSNPLPGFSPPRPKTELNVIRTEIVNILDEIEALKSRSDNDATKIRFGNLEETVIGLETTLDDAVRKLTNLQVFLININSNVDRIKIQVSKIKDHFHALQLKNANLLQDEMVSDIQGRDFDSASKKLYNLTGGLQKNINILVYKVYDKRAANFNLLLKFADNKGVNITTSLAVYQALFFEMESIGDDDCIKILKIIKSLDSKLTETLNSTLTEAEDFKKKVYLIAKEKIAREIKRASTFNNYTAVSELFDKIYVSYENSFNTIIKEAFSDVIHQIDIEELVNFFTTHKYVTQSIWAYSAALYELKRTNNSDHPIVIPIAFELNNVINNLYEPEVLYEAFALKLLLPKSVQILGFNTIVLIKNDRLHQYLYAASDGYKVGTHRAVFTWNHPSIVTQGVWRVDKKAGENKFFIRNVVHNNESLFTFTNEIGHSNAFGRVFTKQSNNNDNLEAFTWELIPKGNYVYIKNSLYDAFMFASIEMYDNDRRYVYTSKKNIYYAYSLWEIESLPASLVCFISNIN